jgi:hypothetical protein
LSEGESVLTEKISGAFVHTPVELAISIGGISKDCIVVPPCSVRSLVVVDLIKGQVEKSSIILSSERPTWLAGRQPASV